MIRFVLTALVPILVLPTFAFAQDTMKWSDVNCAEFKVAVPQGMRCRATQEYAGGQSGVAAGAGGTFRRWSVTGVVNGAKVFYYLHETTSLRSSVTPGSLVDMLKSVSPQGRKGVTFSEPSNRDGVDFVRFVSDAKDSCVGILRGIRPQDRGYKFYVVASRCVPAGSQTSDAEIASFIASTMPRG
jgi:hypothetical protein